MISKLMDGLYICRGDEVSAAVKEFGMDAVVNVAHELNDDVSVTYIKFPMKDDIVDAYGRELYAIAVPSVCGIIKDGKTVLVHCSEGRNRSVAVCIGVVKNMLGLNWVAAEEHVAKRYETARGVSRYFLEGVRIPNPDNMLTRKLRESIEKQLGDEEYVNNRIYYNADIGDAPPRRDGK